MQMLWENLIVNVQQQGTVSVNADATGKLIVNVQQLRTLSVKADATGKFDCQRTITEQSQLMQMLQENMIQDTKHSDSILKCFK